MNATIEKLERKFIPNHFSVTNWENLQPYFETLLQQEINSVEQLEQWLQQISELEAVVSEDACWRQIKMTCDTTNKELEQNFAYFCTDIQPKIQPYADTLNRKLIDCAFTKELPTALYHTYLRNVRKSIELFREANIPIQADLSVMQQQFGAIAGKMTVEVNGNTYTLQQAAKFLENPDRSIREAVYRKIQDRRLADKEALNILYTSLVHHRQQLATNAGFSNYEDYKFVELGRFDYTKDDCYQFHEAVRLHVMPLVNKIYEAKREKLGVPTLRPWDLEATSEQEAPLHPFTTGQELLDKTVACFREMSPFFAECLTTMQQMGHLDLESRMGKAPGGYNCPLAESGAPFIFMNAAGQMDDVSTMIHEGGHAIHSFLSHPLPLSAFKEYPMEIAEVASMAMELMSMQHWDSFFNNPESLQQAKYHQLERVITIFPWIATIDKFQHWIYSNPNHTEEQRRENWLSIMNEFTSPVIDVTGLDNYRSYAWQRQLHLFEVPFYYIEYGIAQLGAIGMWQQYLQNPTNALHNYTHALKLGGTKPLPELYAAAGLTFSFSPSHIKSLMEFVQQQLESL